MQALSVDGRCKTFDASADGYGRGEGFVVAYLGLTSQNSPTLALLQVRLLCVSRMSIRQACSAIHRGSSYHPAFLTHTYTASLLCQLVSSFTSAAFGAAQGSVVNQDGRSSSLTAPNGPSQRELILAVLQTVALRPERIAGIAVHGTGTPLGDPIGRCLRSLARCRTHMHSDHKAIPISITACPSQFVPVVRRGGRPRRSSHQSGQKRAISSASFRQERVWTHRGRCRHGIPALLLVAECGVICTLSMHCRD